MLRSPASVQSVRAFRASSRARIATGSSHRGERADEGVAVDAVEGARHLGLLQDPVMVDRDRPGGAGKMVHQRLGQEMAGTEFETSSPCKAPEPRQLEALDDRLDEDVESLARLREVSRAQAMRPAGLVTERAEGSLDALPDARREGTKQESGCGCRLASQEVHHRPVPRTKEPRKEAFVAILAP
jgi:hypothetical protein